MKMHNSFKAGLIALSLTTVLLPGCGEIKVRAGAPVDASLLESRLVLGRSTEKDVREVMGEPLGVGRSGCHFIPELGPCGHTILKKAKYLYQVEEMVTAFFSGFL